jgi:cytochrome d ubiquinol oxidase subunit II
METVWFMLITTLLVGYVVLDGFDLGVGSIYLLVAKTETEKDQVRRSIGPIWDGNEVWLIAAGGTLFFAFPKAYAATFSIFYLAFFLILWLLILRGLAIELRSQLSNPLWHTFWDVVFSFASTALILLLGIALGNLLRGLPITAVNDPTLPFWTTFLPGIKTGLLDWYTMLVGGLALIILIIQGAGYLALKTTGKLQTRARRIASRSIFILIPFAIIAFVVTLWVQPVIIEHYFLQPFGWILPLLMLASLGWLAFSIWRGFVKKAFIASSLFIITALASALFGLYPRILLNIADPAKSLTIYNSATSSYGLRTGLIWFSVGFMLLLVYVAVMYRSFGGKIIPSNADEY